MVEIVNGTITQSRVGYVTEHTYMTIKEFAEANGVSEELVRQWKHRGIVDGIKVIGGTFILARTPIRLKKRLKNV